MPSSPLHVRPLPVLLVFVGGAAGTLARYLISVAICTPNGLPVPTFIVNILGAFAIGVLLEGLLRGGLDTGWRQRIRLLLGPGLLGGFTTYSTMCVETVLLTENAHYVEGFAYAIVSLLLGVLAAVAGVWAAANLFPMPEAHAAAARSEATGTQLLNLHRPDESKDAR